MTYGYIRVSTDKQDVNNQRIGVTKKAKELGLTIDEWVVDDGVSGTVEYKKRNLGVLVEKCKEGDVVITSEISRLGRNKYMINRIIEELTQVKDCCVHTVKDCVSSYKKDDFVSSIVVSFLGGMAQYEHDMNSKRTKEGLVAARAKGKILGRPVGSKNKKPNLKYEKLVPEIMELLKKALAKVTICKMLDLNRSSFDRIIDRYNLPYEKKKKEQSKTFNLCQNNKGEEKIKVIKGTPSKGAIESEVLKLRQKKIRVSEIAKILNADIKIVKKIVVEYKRQFLERDECVVGITKITGTTVSFDTAEKIYEFTKNFFAI